MFSRLQNYWNYPFWFVCLFLFFESQPESEPERVVDSAASGARRGANVTAAAAVAAAVGAADVAIGVEGRASDHELQLLVDHGMAAEERAPRLLQLVGAALEDAAELGGGKVARGIAEDVERGDRAAPHRVDVRDRVGRGDAAEIVRIVNDRREEIGRRDQRLAIVDPIHRGVVARRVAHQQVRKRPARGQPGKHLAQQRWRELAASPAAVGELCQPDGGSFDWLVHDIP